MLSKGAYLWKKYIWEFNGGPFINLADKSVGYPEREPKRISLVFHLTIMLQALRQVLLVMILGVNMLALHLLLLYTGLFSNCYHMFPFCPFQMLVNFPYCT